MHKLSNNFYIKCLIRSLKEYKCYNNETQRKINDTIFRKLKYNGDFLKNVRLFPHILPNEINVPEYYLHMDIQNMYMKLILDKFIEDVSSIIKQNNEKPNISDIKLHTKNKSLYSYLINKCHISDITLDNSNHIFYPEIITTL